MHKFGYMNTLINYDEAHTKKVVSLLDYNVGAVTTKWSNHIYNKTIFSSS